MKKGQCLPLHFREMFFRQKTTSQIILPLLVIFINSIFKSLHSNTFSPFYEASTDSSGSNFSNRRRCLLLQHNLLSQLAQLVILCFKLKVQCWMVIFFHCTVRVKVVFLVQLSAKAESTKIVKERYEKKLNQQPRSRKNTEKYSASTT